MFCCAVQQYYLCNHFSSVRNALEYLLYVNFSQLPFEGQHLKNKQVPIHNLEVLQGPDLLSFVGDISAIVWSVALSYPIRYIAVTCLVVYVELRFILLNSLSLLLFVLVLFCFVFKVLLWSLCGRSVSCMAAGLLLFYGDSH